jgi:hypothetical protein
MRALTSENDPTRTCGLVSRYIVNLLLIAHPKVEFRRTLFGEFAQRRKVCVNLD